MIEMREAKDDTKGCGGGFSFWIGDVQIPRGFTPETGRPAAERFLALIIPLESELLEMSREYYAKIEWNIQSKGQGKNWPIFNRLQKRLDQLQRAANIQDS